MNRKEKKPDKIIRAGGREFQLYKYRDEYDGKYILNYPDFQENPEYTDEGRPFVMAIQESCEYLEPTDPEYPDPGDCSGCVWCRMETPMDAICVCMCESRKRTETGADEKGGLSCGE